MKKWKQKYEIVQPLNKQESTFLILLILHFHDVKIHRLWNSKFERQQNNHLDRCME